MIDTSLLNEQQKQAVLDDSKYLRIVAGAGSGKTRVLTMRIAHLIQDLDVYPSRILAITFTNKAANEMKERIRAMLNDESGQPWISTIHSLCVRILREDITVMGWPRNFTVMDTDDQKAVLKEGYKKYDLDAKSLSPSSVISYISNCKCEQINPQQAMKIAGTFQEDRQKAQLYEFYDARQNELHALDFDDLILKTVRMFKTFPEVLEKWQKHFHYIHVDEFQDIDAIQYQLIRQLTGKDNHLYVVGDPDQTIYTWRGADVKIILNFKKDFPDAETIMLNQNYRSTSNILNAANSVIRNNHDRLEKDLFSTGEAGEKITHYAAASSDYEAEWIAQKIRELHSHGKPYHDIAVLYRSNYLSRSLEQGMINERIPYIIYGGLRFYERQEVKDALCYLRMADTADDLAFRRIINRPKRGIGDKTLDLLSQQAASEGTTMYESLKNHNPVSGKAGKTLDSFVQMVEKWRAQAADSSTDISELFETIINESGLKKSLEDANEDERVENLKELIDDVRQFMKDYPDSSLDEYLQMVSLYGDRDETQQGDYVQLMTVHAAKGLEFDTVFVSDMNDGIFPNERAMEDGKRGLEEERRLAYVAFTRAKRKLYITEAGGFSYILQRNRTPSRFIDEIDDAYIEHKGGTYDERRAAVNRRADPWVNQTSSSEIPSADEPQAHSKGVTYRRNEKVVHVKFGTGIVISCVNGIATIAFEYPYGVKKIAAGHPSLKRLTDLKE